MKFFSITAARKKLSWESQSNAHCISRFDSERRRLVHRRLGLGQTAASASYTSRKSRVITAKRNTGVSVAGVLVAFAAIAWLAHQQWFYRAFGFQHHAGFAAANVVPAMLLFAVLAGTISFWVSPLVHISSRRFEYEADAFARATMGEAQSLIQALRKLSEKNLSNLTPHPFYSAFYYSHPTLLERERALQVSA
jgi:nitrate reductase gamma subunit